MVKTITIKDTVYEELKAMKKPGESFSDLFERLAGARRSMEVLKRMRGSVVFKDKKAVLERIKREREEWR